MSSVRYRKGHRFFSQLEQLEQRRLLAAATAAVRLDGEVMNTVDEDKGLIVTFTPKTKSYLATSHLLTGRQTGDRGEMARKYFRDRAADFGLRASDVNEATIIHRATETDTGITNVIMRQTLNGILVDNTHMEISFTKYGEVIAAGSNLVTRSVAEQTAAAPNLSTMIHPMNALRVAANELNVNFPATLPQLTYVGGTDLKFTADSPALSQDEIPIVARYYATENGVRLAWKIIMRLPNSSDWYETAIDTTTGKLIHAINYTEYFDSDTHDHGSAVAPATGGANQAAGGTDASYLVYPIPFESPYDGPQTVVNSPWLDAGTNPATDPSPYGWHDLDGVIGAETTNTTGNNVSAQEDRDNNNTGGLQPSGGATLDFNYTADLGIEPINNPTQSAAIVNLFYWNNVIHDIHYKYGFTEQAFNFQQNNYGRGGAGNDRVQADAQDGSGTNNANFATPADGSSGRMQMYLWTAPTPDRDGDFDSGIIAHEYGHGVSNRLITNGTGQMANNQSRGMGEGWSDFYALMFQQTASDTINGRHPIGTYALNQDPNTGAGIRTHPYSWNTTINPITWGYYGSGTYQSPYNPGVNVTRSTAVHWAGTIWCATLWDMNWNLITKHGYDSNLYTGWNPTGTAAERAGNKLALKLVMEAMKIMVPTNPSFVESRDAILAADTALTGGANHNEIWNAFARRGLGENAVSGASTSTALITLDFNAPWADPVVRDAAPSGTYYDSVSSVVFNFNQAMATNTFSIAEDVINFTGPGEADLLGRITGATWVTPSSLRIEFDTLVPTGAYSMTIGPAIRAADDGHMMDQDRDGNLGEPGEDSFTANFSIQREIGPESFGYKAAQYPMENIDLVIGAPGVVTLTSTSGALAPSIVLPSGNSFNFYGTTYTSLFASTEGLITFVSGSTSTANADLTSAPSQAAIAPLWDNYTAATNVAGATDSALLYKIDGNRLIIEWSDMPVGTGTISGTLTFQAILQLNTGATPGRIIFNYPDVTTGDLANRGNGATTGIKNTGTQPLTGQRLLINRDSPTMPWIDSGRAALVALDVTPPTVVSESVRFETSVGTDMTLSDNLESQWAGTNLIVENLTTSEVLNRYFLNYDTGGNVASMTLNNPHLIADGNYRITLLSPNDGSGFADAAGNPMDGDNNGVAGGNHVLDFFFLRGDANRDRSVNIGDFAILAGNFNSAGTFGTGDFNYDGSVNISDFSILASKFNTSLPALRAATGSVANSTGGQRVTTAAAAPARTTSPFSSSAVWTRVEEDAPMLPA